MKSILIPALCLVSYFALAQDKFIEDTHERYGITVKPESGWVYANINSVNWSPSQMLKKGAAYSICVFGASLRSEDGKCAIFLPTVTAKANKETSTKGEEFRMRREVYWTLEYKPDMVNIAPDLPKDFNEMKYLKKYTTSRARKLFNAEEVYTYIVPDAYSEFWIYFPGMEEALTNIPEQQKLLESKPVYVKRFFLYDASGKAYDFLVLYEGDSMPRNLEKMIGEMIRFE